MLNQLLGDKRVSINTTRLYDGRFFTDGRWMLQEFPEDPANQEKNQVTKNLLNRVWNIWFFASFIGIFFNVPQPAEAAHAPEQRVLTAVSSGLNVGSILDRYGDSVQSVSNGVSGFPQAGATKVGPNRVIPMPAVLDQVFPLKHRGGNLAPPPSPFQDNGIISPEKRQSPLGPNASDVYLKQRRLDHEQVRETLLKVAEEFGEDAQYVPYVWGGNQIGNTQACQACRSCIAKKNRLKVEKRKAACTPCRQCGIDCSHFVHRVFQDAGLEFPYTNTASLQRMSPLALLEQLRLVDLGRDLGQVMPGDLLLKKKHIVVLLRVGEVEGRGDVLHVSRSTRKMGPGGGIEIARDVDLKNFAGRLVKILRHKDTMVPDSKDNTVSPVPDRPLGVPDRRNPLLWGSGEFLAQKRYMPYVSPQRNFSDVYNGMLVASGKVSEAESLRVR